MCDVRPLLNCQRQIKVLEGIILNLEEQIPVPRPKPEITLLKMSSYDVLAEIKELDLKRMYPTLMDMGQDYYHTDRVGWAEVFDYIYCIFDMPDYIAGRMDCEDFGILLKGLVSTLFGLNYFAFTIGDSPYGVHGYDIFRTEQGLMLIEPQKAEFFEWGERGYSPEWILL